MVRTLFVIFVALFACISAVSGGSAAGGSEPAAISGSGPTVRDFGAVGDGKADDTAAI